MQKYHNMTIKLRDYQKDIIKAVEICKGSVLIEVPTGGGKSVIASEIAKNEIKEGGKVLIVAPKIILLEQLQATFSEINPQVIHGSKKYDKTHSVFISTLQTSYKRDLGFEPTMIIIDEVHFGFSGKMIKKLLCNFNGRLIGLSATPYNQNGELIEGFDKHINKYDLNYMLKNKYLVPPVCSIPITVDLSDITVQAGDYNQKELNFNFNNFEHISDIVKSTVDIIAKQKATLIFCINISHAKAIATAYTKAGIITEAIHSQLSKNEQDNIMSDFKSGKIKMLANPMMLTTGFDHTQTNCIVLARATKSQNLYRQMVGRGLRLSEDKTEAKILDCSGVIRDLGLPTEPIKQMFIQGSNNTTMCKKCKSRLVYIRKDTYGNLVRVCSECHSTEEIKKQGCACESCGVINGSEAYFVMKLDSLYMTCSICGAETLISSISTHDDLIEVFGDDKLKRTLEWYCFDYMRALHRITDSFEFNFREDVLSHIRALEVYINQNMEKFINYGSEDSVKKAIKDFDYLDLDVVKNSPNWSWEKNGRLFSIELERQLLSKLE